MIDEATRAARAAEREARRKANQERWANDPANANHTRLQRQAAVTPAIEAEAKGDSNGSNSLQRMRDIMSDAGAPLYRRLDAAECVLTFELGPGAAAGADPDTIAYEATVTDPTVFSRPWTMTLALRRRAKTDQIIEYGCIEGERDLQHYTEKEGGKVK